VRLAPPGDRRVVAGPEAASRAGLEGVEKRLPAKLTSTDTTERNLGIPLRVPLFASLVG
jgi:hypothetical protein